MRGAPGNRGPYSSGTLSGGEQHMIAIGRALMSRPKLLLLDEPSLGLAPLIVSDIFQILRNLSDQGIAILLVEQNARVALGLADSGTILESGRVMLSDFATALLEDPDVEDCYLGMKPAARVDGRDKRLRACFRLWLGVDNLTVDTVVLERPSIESKVPFAVSRWYLEDSAGEPWDGAPKAGASEAVLLIGYLGEPVAPGTTIDATINVGTRRLRASARARGRWDEG